MPYAIEVEGLSKYFKVRTQKHILKGLIDPKYRKVHAVKDISFVINEGEAVAFLGPNGAGKTTTTKMLSGLIYPSSGSIRVLGSEPFVRDPDFLSRIGVVMGSKAGLNWDLTARQSFHLHKVIYKIPDSDFKDWLEYLTKLLDVRDHLDTQLRRLSLGERMKMELIGSLLHKPAVLFLDEPTIGLDVLTKRAVRGFLREIRQTLGTTLILTSHDMDDVEQVCDRVLIINKGEKVYDDSLDSLVEQYGRHRYLRLVFASIPDKEKLSKVAELVEQEGASCLLKVESGRMVSVISGLLSEYELLDLHIESVPLEEIISEIFKR